MRKETGLMMSTPMMVADLKGLKTQTRRTRGLNKINENPDDWQLVAIFQDGIARFYNRKTDIEIMIKCPYGGGGDLVWLRETWAELGWYRGDPPIHKLVDNDGNEHDIIYRAECPEFVWLGDDEDLEYRRDGWAKSHWKSSMFMPRWTSRRSHILTNIRCERVQDITEGDAIKEGFEYAMYPPHYMLLRSETGSSYPRPVEINKSFMGYWDSLNTKRGYPWDKNVWVWVLEWKE